MGQFKALMVKNWMLYKRGILGAVLEILIPIICIAFVALVRSLVDIENYDEQSYLGSNNYTYKYYGDPRIVTPYMRPCAADSVVALAPTGDPIVNSLKSTIEALNYKVITFANDDEINEIARDVRYGQDYPYFCFGVSFQNSGNKYKYNLRFNMSNNDNSQVPVTSQNYTLPISVNLNVYLASILSGAIGVTTIVNSFIAQQVTSNTNNVLLNKIAPVYQEEYVYDPIYGFLSNSMEFLTLLPLLLVYARQTSSMLEEKEKKIRESMSIMGMRMWMYYLTWFIRYFAIYLVIHLIGAGILASQLPQVPYYIPLIVFLLFDILLIIQSFFVQIFVTRSKIGIVLALVFFVLQYAISFVTVSISNPSIQLNTLLSIIAHVAFGFAFKTMLYAQANKIPLTFTSQYDYYIINICIVSLVLNIIFWGILTWYLDQVFPNQWGAKKHPCFCCVDKGNQSNSKQDQSNKPNDVKSITQDPINKQRNRNVEVESVEQKYKQMEGNEKTVKIKNLNKYFDDFQAVNNLNINMYTDQIFVLLGHNGAGKTTTISMITGMLEPSEGVIEVFGKRELAEIRNSIGVCPQHDTLYDDLTVEEHLRLFGTFKGLEGENLEQEIRELIKDVNLEEKRDEYAKNLSGGQKRKLSVAIAFSGGSKMIVLDEPTSGMDTSARRYIWEMLKNYKNDRVILLTTHFMDEADYLGDRIAIMSGGKLAALGSNVYLKNKYGVGYNITFVKKSIDIPNQPIVKCVQKHVHNATILTAVSSEIVVQLPMDSVSRFGSMFNEIDTNKEKLGIQSYGISITTLEQVFLKISEIQQKNHDQPQPQQTVTGNGNKVNQELEIQKIELTDSRRIFDEGDQQFQEENWIREDGTCQRFFSHLFATILKRLRVIRRDYKSFVFQLLLPMIIIILAMLLMTVTFIQDFPSKQLTYPAYAKQEGSPVLLPIGADSADSGLLTSLKDKIEEVYGSTVKVQTNIVADSLLFDQDDLFPIKKQLSTFKGGIYFQQTQSLLANTIIPFTSIVNTKSPTSFFTVQTMAAEAYINELAGTDIEISITNYPFPRTFRQLQINQTISGFFGALIFSVALAFKFASIVAFVVKEREDRSKHQQIVSGLNIGSFWFGSFLYDYFLYAIVAGFSVGMCKALDIKSLADGQAFTATCILFFLLGFANIPFTYILSNLFKSYGSALGIVYFFNFISGGFLPIVTLLLRWINSGDSADIGRGLSWVFRLIPAYAFGEGIINIGSLTLLNASVDKNSQFQIFSMEITLASIIYLAVTGLFYCILVFVIESLQQNQKFMRFFFTSESQVEDSNPITDEDVLLERKAALMADSTSYEILTQNLRKVYMLDSEKKYKVAVDSLSFGVHKGEVFGLLGVNGAGKTTTFKILAGQVVSTSGESFICGLKINDNLNEIRKSLGYCPQFDALIDNLTVREQLELFYDMKCLPKKHKDQAILKKIKEMDLEKYTDKLSGSLSGGNKRKLSVAMAMIGNPHIIFLDEPSTGMDPKARRFMWKVISRISTQRKQSTVILTTHSMQEAQALSTRLGIMVNGNFKCIGTPQHIKSRYGSGFEIEIKTKNIKREEIEALNDEKGLKETPTILKAGLPSLLDKIKASEEMKKQISKYGAASYIWHEFESGRSVPVRLVLEFNLTHERVHGILSALQQKVGSCEIIENFESYIRFKTGPSVTVGRLFDFLEGNKDNLKIMQYSIKQATVEQIFNKFAEESGAPAE